MLLLQHGAAVVAMLVAVHVVCVLVTYKLTLYNKKTGEPLLQKDLPWRLRLDFADSLFGVPFYPLITYLAISGATALSGDVNSRWVGVTGESYIFQLLYVVRMLLHTPVQFITLAHKPGLLAQMTAHHLLSVVCFGGGLITGRMHFWALLDGSCEVTTVALNSMFIVESFFPRGFYHKWLKRATGISLFLSFILFRLALFPAWLLFFYADVTNETEATWQRVTWGDVGLRTRN